VRFSVLITVGMTGSGFFFKRCFSTKMSSIRPSGLPARDGNVCGIPCAIAQELLLQLCDALEGATAKSADDSNAVSSPITSAWKCRPPSAKIVHIPSANPSGSSSWWPDPPIFLHPPKPQDAALSRLKHGFESRRERQGNQALSIRQGTSSPTRVQYRGRRSIGFIGSMDSGKIRDALRSSGKHLISTR
jgi:hypothetical protein